MYVIDILVAIPINYSLIFYSISETRTHVNPHVYYPIEQTRVQIIAVILDIIVYFLCLLINLATERSFNL